ncbi:MAG: M81 family metallopeptidase [Pseudomonadota bacterium]
MTRVAIAGFQHETNTFAAQKTDLRAFEVADSWPGLLARNAVVTGTRGLNLPIAGFAARAASQGDLTLFPVLWCAAEPASYVSDAAFDEIARRIVRGIEAALPLDGIYLDLHGAMVTESHEDGEGELLRRIRRAVGDQVPIAVSLDLHANMTEAILRFATTVAVFRTYPHLDMAGTGARAFDHLMAAIDGERPRKALRQLPFLIPLHAQFTGAEPCLSLYRAVEVAGQAPGEWAEFAMGFPAADIHDAGPAVLAFAAREERAEEIAAGLAAEIMAAEPSFDTRLYTPEEVVLEAGHGAGGPVVIGDVQDNPGAGATSDTTGLLHALAAGTRGRALLGLLADAEVAGKAQAAGVGGVFSAALGSKTGPTEPGPYVGRFEVEAVSDGRVRYTGEIYGGGIAELGPSAALRLLDIPGDVRVVVTSNRSQCLDLALFRHFGLEPEAFDIVCVKSTVHFRADFDPIAARVLYAAAPGLNVCRLEEIPYRHLRVGMRLGPLGPAFDLAAE